MAAIPQSTRDSVTVRLLDHAEARWPQLTRVKVTYRGAFGYVTGVLRDGQNIPLCRLRYGGSAHSFGFAIYSAAHDRYQDAVFAHRAPRRHPARSPRHRLHHPPRRVRPRARLMTPPPQPPTNLRSYPLSATGSTRHPRLVLAGYEARHNRTATSSQPPAPPAPAGPPRRRPVPEADQAQAVLGGLINEYEPAACKPRSKPVAEFRNPAGRRTAP